MTTLALQRLEQNAEGTYGQITTADNRRLCVTLERPWLDNRHGVSCIPAGEYEAIKVHSAHFGYDVYQLQHVPGRDAIEMHRGNTVADSEGCILLGTAFGTLNGQHGITGSADAFERFMDAMRGSPTFTLLVRDPAPSPVKVPDGALNPASVPQAA